MLLQMKPYAGLKRHILKRRRLPKFPVINMVVFVCTRNLYSLVCAIKRIVVTFEELKGTTIYNLKFASERETGFYFLLGWQ